MMKQYIIGIDQSTQGTKALLLDEEGKLVYRCDKAHSQLVNDKGWVSHDLEEIYRNTLQAVKELLQISGIHAQQIRSIGISNQRETTAAWNRFTGKPVGYAIVWQCARAKKITEKIEKLGYGEVVQEKTGIPLSPYFSAAKMAWLVQNNSLCKELMEEKALCLGTIDSWLIYKLTRGKVFKTDYSNASRTQLFNIRELKWDSSLCKIFDIDKDALAEVCDSNAFFGKTNCEGILEKEVPIHAVMGDSHAALYGQGCHKKGMVKATYGTGSSIMMNVGDRFIKSHSGLITSLAWSQNGRTEYVLEGNLNYTGAVITWLKDGLQIISKPSETEELARAANPEDHTYIVPAFSGLGAPYWKSGAAAAITGMTRTTGKKEIAKAALECIAYQITDIVGAMKEDIGLCSIEALRADGGPTKNSYLMQFQSDIANMKVEIPAAEELSGIGAAYMAGVSEGFYDEQELFKAIERKSYHPSMNEKLRQEKYTGWKAAVHKTIL